MSLFSQKSRRARAEVFYNGKNISQDISKHLLNLAITTPMGGEAEDLSLKLEDKAALWQGEWLPDKGAELEISLITFDGLEERRTYFGPFEIDEVCSRGYPSEVEIKAVSTPWDNALRGIERTRSWEKVQLYRIAKDIAGEANIRLFYNVQHNPTLERVEQSQESDLSFLYKLCQDHGLALQVDNNSLIVFDEAEYEQEEPIAAIVKPGTEYKGEADRVYKPLSYSISSKHRDIYKACHVKYQKPDTDQFIEFTFTAPDKTIGKTMEVNEQVNDMAEAERLAKRRLRAANAREISFSCSLLGAPDIYGGAVVELVGFGAFDGRYIITRATHTLSDGLTTNLEGRRCLNGY